MERVKINFALLFARFFVPAAILALALFAMGSAPALSAEDSTIKATVSPKEVSIGPFYDGGTLSVTGQIPSDCEAVVRIMGKRSELHLKKKGKALGLLWMNLDTLTFENVPNVYLLYTSKKFEELMGPAKESSSGWKLSLVSLRENMQVSPVSPEREALLRELIKLKESEGLYSIKNGIHYTNAAGSEKTFEGKLEVPSRLPPGQYSVQVYALRGGEVVAESAQPLEVKLESVPALMSGLAFNHGALYGILATLIALGAGLVTGFVFGGGKGAH